MRPLRDRLLWRYAVKRYDRTKRIDPALIDELRNAIVMAPSSFGLAAAELEIDANPMEGFVASSYDDILGLRELGLHAVVICGLGYRSASDPFAALAKVRKPDLFSDKLPV